MKRTAHLYVPTGIHLPLDPLNEALSYVTTKLWPDGKFVGASYGLCCKMQTAVDKDLNLKQVVL